MSTGKAIRRIALWVMIICAAIAIAILFLKGQVVWAVFWCVISATVGAFEIYNVFISSEKDTISNTWKEWNKKDKIAYLVLLLLWIGLTAFIIHLAVW